MKSKKMNQRPPVIVGLGEALFDCFSDRAVLGGAPVNFAVHAHSLVREVGGRGVVATRVGSDELGKRYLEELEARGVDRRYVQLDREHPTGTVSVQLDAEGHASYEFASNVAWDHLEFTESWQELAAECDAISFGTLAQRSESSREAIARFLTAAENAIRLFDVNIRQQFYSAEIIDLSLQAATAVKLNDAELGEVCSLLELADPAAAVADQARAILSKYHLDWLALTRGARGTALYADGKCFEGEPAKYASEPQADSVGAGDACCAGLIVGRLYDWPHEKTLSLANQMGAFVATRRGATPELPAAMVNALKAMD